MSHPTRMDRVLIWVRKAPSGRSHVGLAPAAKRILRQLERCGAVRRDGLTWTATATEPATLPVNRR